MSDDKEEFLSSLGDDMSELTQKAMESSLKLSPDEIIEQSSLVIKTNIDAINDFVDDTPKAFRDIYNSQHRTAFAMVAESGDPYSFQVVSEALLDEFDKMPELDDVEDEDENTALASLLVTLMSLGSYLTGLLRAHEMLVRAKE